MPPVNCDRCRYLCNYHYDLQALERTYACGLNVAKYHNVIEIYDSEIRKGRQWFCPL
jgi:hypothetical protein